jgi:hypothetical protein
MSASVLLRGRVEAERGEAARDAARDETGSPRQESKSTGSALLQAALTRENLQKAFKRVRANRADQFYEAPIKPIVIARSEATWQSRRPIGLPRPFGPRNDGGSSLGFNWLICSKGGAGADGLDIPNRSAILWAQKRLLLNTVAVLRPPSSDP